MASSSSSSPEMSVPRSANNTDPPVPMQARLHEVLEDLSSRFILNLPDEELASLERVCFQVEQAHWYYEDFVREQDPSFPTMTLKKFSNSLFHVCPLLSHWGDDHEQTFQSFLAYKTRVPVCGAIMINETWDKCLLVKGWKATSAWSFPKGKINEQEPRPRCAVREVLEETGYDLDEQIDPSNVVELSIKDQSISLYIVPNVPEDFHFETRTRKEISKISWFKLTDLPTWKRNKAVPGKFYLITPFIGPLKAFLRDHKPKDLPRRTLKQYMPPAVDLDTHISSEEETHGDEIAIAQESSSQSSSADNGEPQTPSPLYSEPLVNHAIDVVDLSMQQTLNMDSVDPHFARLLSSLSLSASAAPPTGPGGKVEATIQPSTPSPPVPSAPIVQNKIPPPTSHGYTSTISQTYSSSFTMGLQVSPTPSSTAVSASASSHAGHLASLRRLHASSGDLARLGTNGLVPSQSVSIPQQSSSVKADIPLSPLQAKGSVVPKHMKYISILENIAQESERMTPRLERQAQMMNEASPAVQSQLGLPGASSSSHLTYGVHTESPVIYSSRPGVSTTNSAFPTSTLHVGPPIDAFTVRPQTSNTFHRPPYRGLSSRPSMNENQLRVMMSGPGIRPPTSQSYGPYPSPFSAPRQPAVHSFTAPQAYPSSRPQPPSNSHMVPGPQHLTPGQYLAPAPLSMPAFNVVPRTNPAHLLSILNAPHAAPVYNAFPGSLGAPGLR